MLRWQDLTGLSNEQLGALDVAEVNLACAEEFPEVGSLDALECIQRLNHYAKCAVHYTEKRMPEFRAKPEVYRNSEGVFRMVCIMRLLQGKFGVRYNPAKMAEDAPFGSVDSFILGALLGEGGTCASLPVVYAAVGRRLGYPIKLVSALRHLFVRWDDPEGERFNIEINNHSLDSPPDDYYRKGRYEVTEVVERAGCLLKSMTPRDELSSFLAERGHRWLELEQRRRAVEAFAWAWSLAPENILLKNRLARTMDEWAAQLRASGPPGFPTLFFTWPPRRFPDAIPWLMEKNILCLEAWENILKTAELNEQWWEPMRRGRPVPRKPTKAIIVCKPSGGCEISFRFN